MLMAEGIAPTLFKNFVSNDLEKAFAKNRGEGISKCFYEQSYFD